MERRWPDVYNALMWRLLSDEVLRKSYDSVTRAVKKEEEDEAPLDDRISRAARLCRHVFSKAEVVNNYIQMLKPSVRKAIEKSVSFKSDSDKNNLEDICQAAV